jgi:hypothetical protein
MKRFLTLALAGALVLGVGSVAYANICAFDPVPAATLLFPFVAYNYVEGEASDNALDTLFAITNVSSDAQIVHITLWTDYSVSVLDWNVLLTGYDVYTFSLRDILKYGSIPATFNNAHDDLVDGLGLPADDGVINEGVLDQGPISNASPLTAPPAWGTGPGLDDPEDTTGLNCGPGDEAYPGLFATAAGVIPPDVLLFFRQLLEGSQTANNGFNECDGGAPLTNFNLTPESWWDARTVGDDTWAYLTADVVNVCNKAFPDEEAYWSPRIVEEYNVLIGDVAWINRDLNFSEVQNAVHLEADVNIDAVATESPNNGWATTFYSRYANDFGESDYREPLGTAWAFRYQDATLGNGDELKTYIRAFKAQSRDDAPNGIVWDLGADLDALNNLADLLWSYNCLAYTYYVWDNDENIDVVPVDRPPWSGGPQTPLGVVPNLLPLETQEVDAAQFNLVANFGWMLFVWPASNFAEAEWLDEGPVYYQTWMGVKYATSTPGVALSSGFSGAKDGALIANYNCFAQQVIPGLGINFRGIVWLGFDGEYGYAISSRTAE